MAIYIDGVLLPSPQSYARSPVVKHVDYVSINEMVLRDKAAGADEWSYVLGWEALTTDEYDLIRTAWEEVMSYEGAVFLTFEDLTGTEYYILPDNEESVSFTYTMYNGRVSTNPAYITLYDCTLLFRARAMS